VYIDDISVDEYYWSPADIDKNGYVNFIDYAIFANAWLSEPGDSEWNHKCDIGNPVNSYIDYNDLFVFCEGWLWQAGWLKTSPSGMGTMDSGTGESVELAEEVYLSASAEPEQVIQPDTCLTAVEIEELLKWLEEIWLDPEVRETIDEEQWLKFIESVKSGLE
jgi:hypothetical protein